MITLRTYAQVTSAIDTLFYSGDSNVIKLDNQFIIESSLKLVGQNSTVIPLDVRPIIGELLFADTLNSQKIVISYDYLKNGLPLTLGPKWKTLPILSPKKEVNDSIQQVNKGKTINNNSNVFSSGSLYRQIQVSPMGGSDFTGGLQMQINGKISEGVSISGILTDQDFPIQPEGTTRELDDLDNVHFMITHDNFKLNAGDILYENHNIKRKLIGLNNNFDYTGLSGSTVYAKSKGNYKYLEIKGRDGDQGPYQLLGNDGDRDVVVLAGTEKVWVNGKELIRGTNYDYIIDYSTAEVTFTPRVMIDFDSDLAFEYQYSDYQYQKAFIGGHFKKKLGENGLIDIGLYNEDDRYQEQDLNDEYFDSLASISNGSIIVSTAIINEDGDYILNNGVYEYDPSYMSADSNRYQVVFQYNGNGEYERKISDQGRIYYAFLPEEDRNKFIQLYTPFRTIQAPKSHHFGYVDYGYKVNDYLSLVGKFSGSLVDQNRMNSGTLNRGGSYKYGLNIDSLDLGPGLLNLNFDNWKRETRYKSIGRENEVTHTRLWNLDSSMTRDVNETSIQSEYIIDGLSRSYFELARLSYLGKENTRISLHQRILNKTFNNSFFNYISINDEPKNFHRAEANLQFNINAFSPFLALLSEEDKLKGRFSKVGVGLNIDQGDRKLKTGFDVRIDENNIENDDTYSTRDFVGYIQYYKRGNSGINQNIIFKKRIKNGGHTISDQDYSLFDMDISKYGGTSPMRWGIKLRQEQTLVQQRTVVYDSVGLGLGQYRYDPVFNTYISDPNGAFVSYSILTGERTPNTVIRGSQDMTLDLEKFANIPNTIVRINTRQEFQGGRSGFVNFIDPEINDSLISRSNLFNRFEVNYTDIRRVLFWLENSENFNGFDSRGNNLVSSKETGLDINQPLTKTLAIRNQGKIKSNVVQSTVSTLRNRNSSGWWNDLQIQMRLNHSMDFDIGLLLGAESGLQKEMNFNGNAIGLNISSRILLKDVGRFQTDINYVKVIEENNLSFLPPETFNGFPIGISFRTNSRFTYSISRSISIVLSMNTIDDQRYNDFISFQGEIRAYF